MRFGTILENGTVRTKSLAKHGNRAHKMAIEPGSARNFFSCGEDGVVRHVRVPINTLVVAMIHCSED